MAKRTRVFLLAAAGTLVAGIAIAFVGSSMGLPLLAALGSTTPPELAYVPDGARLIAFADIRQVMNSGFRSRVEEYTRQNRSKTDALEARTGINLGTDIDRIVVSSAAGPVPGAGMQRSLLIARGRFDQTRIEGLMRQQGGRTEQYRGTRTVLSKNDTQDATLAFVEPGLILFGDTASVHAAIDTRTGAAAITSNKQLMALVGDVDDGTAWTVARFDEIAARTPLPPAVAGQLPPINWLAASGRVDGDIRGFVRAETRDEQAAQDLRDVVRGFLALAKMQRGPQPALKSMFDSIQLGGEGKTVSLSFEVTPEMLDLLNSGTALRRAPSSPRRARPPASPEIF